MHHIINTIVRFQSGFAFQFLFRNTFTKILRLGIDVSKLLDSTIFTYQISLDGWPETHSSSKTLIKGYNKSIFRLQGKYDSIFAKEFGRFGDENESQSYKNLNKKYKIQYMLNCLPSMGNN